MIRSESPLGVLFGLIGIVAVPFVAVGAANLWKERENLVKQIKDQIPTGDKEDGDGEHERD